MAYESCPRLALAINVGRGSHVVGATQRRLNGLKFVRQYPIGPYYVDFVCRERRIIVEIDGATHGTEEELAYDAQRTGYLHTQGFRVFRVNNGDVYENLNGICEGLIAFAEEIN